MKDDVGEYEILLLSRCVPVSLPVVASPNSMEASISIFPDTESSEALWSGFCSGMLRSLGGVAGLKIGHSCLSPETEAISRGCSEASMRQRPSLLGLGSVESRAKGREGRAFSCGSGLSFASKPSLFTYECQNSGQWSLKRHHGTF